MGGGGGGGGGRGGGGLRDVYRQTETFPFKTGLN